jgi:hypothetical protein
MYVGNTDNTMAICSINPTTGGLSNCSNSITTMPYLVGMVAINYTASSYIYVADMTNSRVQQCLLNASTGAISNCTLVGSGFNYPGGIAGSRSIGSYATVYVANIGSAKVSKCAVTAGAGIPSLSCSNSGATGLTQPAGIYLDIR